MGTVRVFRQKFTLEDAIEFHAFAPLEASMRVTNGIPLGCSFLLPVGTINFGTQTRKVPALGRDPNNTDHELCHSNMEGTWSH